MFIADLLYGVGWMGVVDDSDVANIVAGVVKVLVALYGMDLALVE